MKKVLLLGLVSLLANLGNVAQAKDGYNLLSNLQSEAYVHNVIVGEFDPIYVGDACLVELITAESEVSANKMALLMTDIDCIDHKDQLFIGQKISAQLMRGETVRDENVLQVLKQISTAKQFIYSQF